MNVCIHLFVDDYKNSKENKQNLKKHERSKNYPIIQWHDFKVESNFSPKVYVIKALDVVTLAPTFELILS